MVNAIISVGNSIRSTLANADAPGSDALNKSMDALKELLLPHWAEDKTRRAAEAKKVLEREVAGGPLKVKVVGKDKSKTRGRR